MRGEPLPNQFTVAVLLEIEGFVDLHISIERCHFVASLIRSPDRLW
jgi:hypothetical protein